MRRVRTHFFTASLTIINQAAGHTSSYCCVHQDSPHAAMMANMGHVLLAAGVCVTACILLSGPLLVLATATAADLPRPVVPTSCISQKKGSLPTTEGGGAVGECVFPFTYSGRTYTACVDPVGFGGVGWCSFDSHYGALSNRWGYCTDACPKRHVQLQGKFCAHAMAAQVISAHRV